MRRTITGALAAALLAAGPVALAAGLAQGGPADAATTKAAPPRADARQASTPACRNADLKASRGRADGAAGTIYVTIRLKNISGHACHTGGYGGVSLVGHGNGTQIGAAADRVGKHWKTIVLKPGQRVRGWVGVGEAGNYDRSRCRPVKADGFRIYAPNQTRSQFVEYRTVGCRNARVHLLTHEAYHR